MKLLRMKGNEMLLLFITFRFSFYDICNIHDQKNKRKFIRTQTSISEQLLLSLNIVPQGKCGFFSSRAGFVGQIILQSPHCKYAAVEREGELRLTQEYKYQSFGDITTDFISSARESVIKMVLCFHSHSLALNEQLGNEIQKWISDLN